MRVISYALALLILAAGTAAAKDIQVAMKGMQYNPSKIKAKRGDVLVFVNDDSVDHNVFIPTYGFGANYGRMKPGETRRVPIVKPGHFVVECVFHDAMKIQIAVE